MTSWNHRVIKRVHHLKNYYPDTEIDNWDEDSFGVHEVFYNDDGVIDGWTESPVDPHGETLDELKQSIHRFEIATEKPMLIEKEKDGGGDKLVEIDD